MKRFHVTIMSIDPGDHSEDPHQKYGYDVEATSESEAIKEGTKAFKERHGDLPIYWVEAFDF